MKLELSYNYAQLKELVKKAVSAGRTPFIWGPPGIGKSSLAREVAGELGMEFRRVDVPLLQPIDYVAAVPNHETKTVELYPCGHVPTRGNVLICFEDLPHAKQYQMVPVMQIIQDRRIGPVEFESSVRFIVTGNREEDLAGANTVISTILNRTCHFNLEPDVDLWRAWAQANELDERIVAFLGAYPEYLLETPKEGVKAWPTPRSWHIASDLIKGVTRTDALRALVASAVGDHVAQVFMSWYKYLRDTDPMEIIRDGRVPSIVERPQLFAVIASVTTTLKENPKLVKNYGANVVRFWKSLDGDYRMAFLKELIIHRKGNGTGDLKLVESLSKAPGGEEILEYVRNLVRGASGFTGKLT